MLTSHPCCVQSKATKNMQMGHESLRRLNSTSSAGDKASKSKNLNANAMPVFAYVAAPQHPRAHPKSRRGMNSSVTLGCSVLVMKPKTCQVSCGLQFPSGGFKVLLLQYLVFRSTFHETTNSPP